MRDALALAAWCLVTFAAAAVGSAASIGAPSFYEELRKPAWAPPAAVFGPVWTVLYALMAVAAWLVWRRRGLRGARTAFALFFGQLVLNALWTWLFFAWRLGGAALADIALLWLAIVATMVLFRRTSATAAILLTPYLAWVTFAAALNAALWSLNPAVLR